MEKRLRNASGERKLLDQFAKKTAGRLGRRFP
jgi:hypothetical protein